MDEQLVRRAANAGAVTRWGRVVTHPRNQHSATIWMHHRLTRQTRNVRHLLRRTNDRTGRVRSSGYATS